jgi:hypothetical protein
VVLLDQATLDRKEVTLYFQALLLLVAAVVVKDQIHLPLMAALAAAVAKVLPEVVGHPAKEIMAVHL